MTTATRAFEPLDDEHRQHWMSCVARLQPESYRTDRYRLVFWYLVTAAGLGERTAALIKDWAKSWGIPDGGKMPTGLSSGERSIYKLALALYGNDPYDIRQLADLDIRLFEAALRAIRYMFG